MQGNFTNMKHRSDRDRQPAVHSETPTLAPQVVFKCSAVRCSAVQLACCLPMLAHACLSRTNGSQRSRTNSDLDAVDTGYFADFVCYMLLHMLHMDHHMDPGGT